MIFVFAVVDVMYYVHWFTNSVPSLHPLDDQSHLVMVYDLFNVLLDAVCQYFVRILVSMFISEVSGVGAPAADRSPDIWVADLGAHWSPALGLCTRAAERLADQGARPPGVSVVGAQVTDRGAPFVLQFHQLLSVCSGFLLLPLSVLEHYIFLDMFPFQLGFQLSWNAVLHSNFLQSFVFLFHFDIINLGPLSSFSFESA